MTPTRITTGSPRTRILATLAGEVDMAGIAHRCELEVSVCYGVLGSLLRDGLVRVRDDRKGYALYRRL